MIEPIETSLNPPKIKTIKVLIAHSRLDKFLANQEWQGVSRTQIQQWIKAGKVTLNGKVVLAADANLNPKDELVVTVPDLTELPIKGEVMDFPILYEDNDLLVLHKPQGLTVHPSPGHPTATLVHGLLHHCGRNLSGIGGVLRPGIVHRLDRNTSGLMVVAKNDVSHQHLSRQFHERQIKRSYVALVWGRVTKPNSANHIGLIDATIGRHPKDRLRMAIVPVEKGGRQARTNYQLLQQDFGVSLLQCQLQTGRTHQIRVHFASIKHPLVGDKIYGAHARQAEKSTPKEIALALTHFPRQCLHSYELGFIHPTKNQPLHFLYPAPLDMMTLFQQLGFDKTAANLWQEKNHQV